MAIMRVEILSRTEGLNRLQVLSLAGNKLTDRAASTLANSKNLINLTRLFLQTNSLGPNGINDLGQSQQ